jgi:hypothetical protein
MPSNNRNGALRLRFEVTSKPVRVHVYSFCECGRRQWHCGLVLQSWRSMLSDIDRERSFNEWDEAK